MVALGTARASFGLVARASMMTAYINDFVPKEKK